MAAPEGVDVYPTAPCVAPVYRQFNGFAARPYVHKNPLDALLMKLVVIAKTHQVLQQALLVDGRARIGNSHAPPIGLARDQAIAF